MRLIRTVDLDVNELAVYDYRKFNLVMNRAVRCSTKTMSGEQRTYNVRLNDIARHNDFSKDIRNIYDRISIYFDDDTNAFISKGELKLYNRYKIGNYNINESFHRYENIIKRCYTSEILLIFGISYTIWTEQEKWYIPEESTIIDDIDKLFNYTLASFKRVIHTILYSENGFGSRVRDPEPYIIEL